MTATTIVVGILVLGAAIAAFLVMRSARGRRGAVQDIPPAMRPAYSDAELEQTVQYRYRAWGMVLFIFFALFLPVYWFFEASRLNAETEGFFVQSVVRGEALYQENCATCHGAEGQGGAAPSPYGQDSWPAPNLTTIAARYSENPNFADVRDYIVATIERGRPGTPMPTWGAAYGGPMTDQQIQEITDWILASQVEEAPANGATEGADDGATEGDDTGSTVPDASTDAATEGTTEGATGGATEGATGGATEPAATESPADDGTEVATASLTGADLYAENCVKCHGEDGDGMYVPAEGEEGNPALRPGPSLIGVFERHSRETILGILQNGINVNNFISMPPWQNGYMYPGTRYDDEQLNAIIDHLESLQPDTLPEGADRYQTPGSGPPGDSLPQEGDTTTALRDAVRG